MMMMWKSAPAIPLTGQPWAGPGFSGELKPIIWCTSPIMSRSGKSSILVAQVGVSGSTSIGKRVTLAGQVGVVGHITIGDDAIAGAKTGISGNVPAGQVVSGYPHMPHRDWLKSSRTITKLPEMRMTLKKLEDKVERLESILQELKGG